MKAAYSVYEDTAQINALALDKGGLNSISYNIINELFSNVHINIREGKERCLFASAITPDGLKNHLSSIINTGKVMVINGAQGTGTDKLLDKVKTAAVEKGFSVELYFCPLNPSKLEHMVIPEIDTAFTTFNKYHSVDLKTYDSINLDELLDKSVLQKNAYALEQNEQEFEKLLNMAIGTISKAKAIHDEMEAYYIPNMDFEAVQRCWEATMARILDYADEQV